MKSSRLFFALLLVFVFAPALRAETLHDRWFSLRLSGQPAGWAHELVTQADGRIESHTAMKMTMKRGPIEIEVEIAAVFTETEDGKPIAAKVTKKLGQMNTVETMTFTDSGIDLTVEQSGRTHTRKLPKPKEDWMPPAAAGRFVEGKLEQDAKAFSFKTIDPSSGTKVIEMQWKYEGEDAVELIGKTVPAQVWAVSMSHVPGMVTRQYVDDEGKSLKTRVAMMPGMEMEMIETEKAIALGEIDPPELLIASMVKPDKPIANPRDTRWAVYELKVNPPKDDPDFSPQIARGGYQRVTYGDRHTMRVVVNLDEPTAPGDDLPTDEHRAASGMLDSDDPVIKKLTEQALVGIAEDAPAAQKAEALRRFVHNHIDEKDLSVGFASATETARTGQGDCSEHGVLLAALLRAADIPSRVVSGLLYVDSFLNQAGVFGYHMWTQAWVGEQGGGGHWIDLDPTLGNETPYDATHIALAYGSLSDAESINDMVVMAPLLGRLSIKVVDVGGQ